MRARAAECTLYVLVGLAFLPLALVEGNALVHYLMKPSMLEVRDAALEAPALVTAVYGLYLLIPAAAVAIYVFVVASRTAKIYAAILLATLCITLGLGYAASQFPFNSWGRLFLESVPMLLFLVFTVALLVMRCLSWMKAPNSAMYGDTYSAPLRAPDTARNRGR